MAPCLPRSWDPMLRRAPRVECDVPRGLNLRGLAGLGHSTRAPPTARQAPTVAPRPPQNPPLATSLVHLHRFEGFPQAAEHPVTLEEVPWGGASSESDASAAAVLRLPATRWSLSAHRRDCRLSFSSRLGGNGHNQGEGAQRAGEHAGRAHASCQCRLLADRAIACCRTLLPWM